ncbi:MAG: lysoplasmalogenase [Ferruginibacter sp.]
MQQKTKVFTFLFFIVFAIQLYAEYRDNAGLRLFSKPLIVLALMAWLYSGTGLTSRFNVLIFTGLGFALAGDVLLMFQDYNSSFFIFGLIAFLLCHIFYIAAFNEDRKAKSIVKNPFFIWAIIVFAAFCAALFFYLQPHLGALQYPVLVYAIIISMMAIMAVSRYGKVNLMSFEIIFYGAIFFLFSDSILAYNKFVEVLPQAGVIIMSSYMLAQYLIVFGTVARKQISLQNEAQTS